jgi:hypothetical protein
MSREHMYHPDHPVLDNGMEWDDAVHAAVSTAKGRGGEVSVAHRESTRDSNAAQWVGMLPQPVGQSATVPEFIEYLDALKQAVAQIESELGPQTEEHRASQWYQGLNTRLEGLSSLQPDHFHDPVATDGQLGDHAAALAQFRSEVAQILADFPGDAQVEESLQHAMSLIDSLVDQAERTFDAAPEKWDPETWSAS